MKAATLPALLICMAVAVGHAADPKGLAEFRRKALACEKQDVWKKIDCQVSPAVALKESQKQGKPLLVALVVGHRGEKDATEC